MIIIKFRNFLNECKIEYQDRRRQKMCISLARHHASFRICQKLICTFKYCGFDGFFILFISNNCLTLLRFLRSLSNFLGLGQRPKNTTDALLFLWKSSPNLVLRHIVPTSESKSFFCGSATKRFVFVILRLILLFYENLGVQSLNSRAGKEN